MSGGGAKKVLSDTVEWQLLETVYNQPMSLIIGGVVLAAAAVFAWVHTREIWFLVWALAAVLALVGRLVLDHAFRCRGERTKGFGVWRARFIAGAWAMSALWGIAAVTIVSPVGETVRLLLIVVQIALVMGTVTRSAGCPTAVKGQIVLALGPLFLVNIAAGDADHVALGAFAVFLIVATLIILRNLYTQAVLMLCANEDNLALIQTVRQVNTELAAAILQLEGIATTDALTGVGNRRQFDDVLSKEVLRVRNATNELSVLMLDVDIFKGFNDVYGHQAGDFCLRQVAEALSATLLRPTDVIARYGGEEFAAILPQTGTVAAAAVAEKMRADVEALAIPSVWGVMGKVTVSIGVATFAAGQHGNPEDYIRAADAALYLAKAAGRNCVRVAPAGISHGAKSTLKHV